MQQWFLDELVTDSDYVVCLTVDSLPQSDLRARHPGFPSACSSTTTSVATRPASPVPSPCAYSTATRCSPASPAWRPRARCWRRQGHPNALRTRLEQLSQQTCTYLGRR
ncbi:hypothetical protein ACPA9J_10505 [Pseudomonas aeruginosa]